MQREGDAERRERRESTAFVEFLEGVGRRIVELRGKAGLTQQEAAARAGLDLRSWQRLEAGGANSTMLVFHDVARALGVEVRQVVHPKRARTPNPAPRGPGRPRKKRGGKQSK